jgi:anaerobic selenocysteine-containing dehydrogenase
VPGHEEVVFADGEFATPSGKIELSSLEAAQRWNVGSLPEYGEPQESIRDAASGKYPFYMMTPNTKNRIHSQFNNLRMIRRVSDRPQVSIHPEDAKQRGIENGALVRIFNDRGDLRVEARFDLGLRRGCVSITNGWWISDGGTVNFCSPGRETDMGHGAAFHDNLVDVEPA